MRGTGQPCVAFISLAPQFPKPPSQNSRNESSCTPGKKIASRSNGSHTGPLPLLHSFSGNRSWPPTAVPAPSPHLPPERRKLTTAAQFSGTEGSHESWADPPFPTQQSWTTPKASRQQQYQCLTKSYLPFPRQWPNSHRSVRGLATSTPFSAPQSY